MAFTYCARHQDGIRCLGHPSVTTHCADKLIRLMVSRGKYAEASRFVQAVSPEPSTDKDIRFRMALHLKISLLDALRFQVGLCRVHPSGTSPHHGFLETLPDFAVGGYLMAAIRPVFFS